MPRYTWQITRAAQEEQYAGRSHLLACPRTGVGIFAEPVKRIVNFVKDSLVSGQHSCCKRRSCDAHVRGHRVGVSGDVWDEQLTEMQGVVFWVRDPCGLRGAVGRRQDGSRG